MSLEISLNKIEQTTILLLSKVRQIKYSGIIRLQLLYGYTTFDDDILRYFLNQEHLDWFESYDPTYPSGLNSLRTEPRGLFKEPKISPKIPKDVSYGDRIKIIESKAKEEFGKVESVVKEAYKEAERCTYVLERLGMLEIKEVEKKNLFGEPLPTEKWISITPEGDKLSERIADKRSLIVRTKSENRTNIFIACAFGRKEIDNLYDSVLVPSCESLGYNPVRIDLTEPTTTITESILVNIQSAEISIADLTYARPSVYFEAGFANGLGVPLLLTCRSDHLSSKNQSKRVHFDLEQYKISFWDITKDGSFLWKKGMHPKARIKNLLDNKL